MLEIASLIIVNLLIATLIGFILGTIIAKDKSKKVKNFESNKKDEKNNKVNTGINPIFQKNSNVDNKPLVMSSPKISGKDNLRKIKGITKKIEEDLNALGIYHFEQIADWSSKNCNWIETFLHESNCVKNNQWVEQAKILKTGKETLYSQKIEDNEIEG